MNALVMVDVQNDFISGSLAVPNGRDIVPVLNKIQNDFDLVVATQDWHPHDHKSFAANNEGKSIGDIIDLNGTQYFLWPEHCVQMTTGAQIAPRLDVRKVAAIFRKGMNKMVDSYSAFCDNDRETDTYLAHYLRSAGVVDVFIAGLATDYCVKFTALDAVERGFNVKLVVDACRGVNVNPGDVDAALKEMESCGIELV